MTSGQRELACYLAQDLLIPYAAGEVSEATRAWVEAHLSDCADCRRTYAVAIAGPADDPFTPQDMPPPEPGRKLVRRVRLTVLAVTAVIITLVVGVLGLGWGIMKIRHMSNMPTVHGVPVPAVSAKMVVEVDLSALGLQPRSTSPLSLQTGGFEDGALAEYTTVDGDVVQLAAYRFETADAASRFYHNWLKEFRVRTLLLETHNRGERASKFRSGDQIYYGWTAEGWVFQISVPSDVPEAVDLRDQIRDSLLATYHR